MLSYLNHNEVAQEKRWLGIYTGPQSQEISHDFYLLSLLLTPQKILGLFVLFLLEGGEHIFLKAPEGILTSAFQFCLENCGSGEGQGSSGSEMASGSPAVKNADSWALHVGFCRE